MVQEACNLQHHLGEGPYREGDSIALRVWCGAEDAPLDTIEFHFAAPHKDRAALTAEGSFS
ncbi:MAG: hypothetical protein CL927_02820 [Deltaproteobacteria bacterium]|nr:hypothetical protein [Deltaproteobacteria bacterium]HCH62862.1 hypothetical protein [Deltaproteobacteria bacterium]